MCHLFQRVSVVVKLFPSTVLVYKPKKQGHERKNIPQSTSITGGRATFIYTWACVWTGGLLMLRARTFS